MKSLPWRLRFPERKRETARAPLVIASPPPRALPCPALRWVGNGGKIALRSFDWNTDADAICRWQTETYALNFPEFQFTDSFASAFRHDLRRAILDDNHALFVLDEGPSGGKSCGFIWLVVCQNTWTNERYGYVNNLYIAPEKRGFDLGSALLDFSTEWFGKRRIHRLRLTVTASNAAACRLYEKNGYQTTRLEMEKEI
ncbi:Ribosomal protein S18 acetylase RimI [Abditibacterium utsteinense]|uniref:Ribosomal protein S18 acetylase RimI n=1 Tax=Abditibacterium utsteinense TaxID=1960156 RepID=A0A2S8SQ15_9BACT|nr:N-acetyltransferase [Abditibacterium utsteinense]PQV62893.1 Ribosomal protein S18 acetylase RimI [Abditibacterium utsteinense]